MSRPANRFRHMAIHSTVLVHQGLTINEIAKQLGLRWDQVSSALPSMEHTGLLLSEDEEGRLYAHKKQPVEGT